MKNSTNLEFNRFTDLANNDSLSGFTDEQGRAWVAQQIHFAYDVFFEFLTKVKPKRILEIGTGEGGLTYFLSAVCKLQNIDCTIRSYDPHGRPQYQWLQNAGVDQRLENIFNENYDKIANTEVIDFIKSDGITIVLCDGAFKKGEFKMLSEHLKTNDFILAHDYAYDANVFVKDINRKIWNWLEIIEADIIEPCNEYGLISYNNDEFNSCAWVCKQKK